MNLIFRRTEIKNATYQVFKSAKNDFAKWFDGVRHPAFDKTFPIDIFFLRLGMLQNHSLLNLRLSNMVSNLRMINHRFLFLRIGQGK